MEKISANLAKWMAMQEQRIDDLIKAAEHIRTAAEWIYFLNTLEIDWAKQIEQIQAGMPPELHGSDTLVMECLIDMLANKKKSIIRNLKVM